MLNLVDRVIDYGGTHIVNMAKFVKESLLGNCCGKGTHNYKKK